MRNILPLSQRELERFNKNIATSDGCWGWTGPRHDFGYGVFALKRDGKWGREYAHRLAWLVNFGDIPDGLCVCHRCDNPPCTNPDHLFIGTNGDNIRDAIAKGRTPIGTKEGAVNHNDTMQRGDAHWSHRHDEWVRRGSKHHMASLSEETVLAIRAEYAKGGRTQREVATMFNTHYGNVWGIVNRKTWRHI